MKWAVLVVRVLVGLGFFASGLTWFLHLMEAQLPEGPAGEFTGLLMKSHYMDAVKVFELVGGVLILSGRMAPLGITLVTPVVVNILFYEIFFLHGPGPGHLLVPLCAFLVYGYWPYFAPVFSMNARARSSS